MIKRKGIVLNVPCRHKRADIFYIYRLIILRVFNFRGKYYSCKHHLKLSVGRQMLQAKKLAKYFGQRLLFKNVEFELYPQSIHILQGKNGAGKSTLFKILCGLLEADNGEIVTDLNIAEVGYLAHANFLYPQMTALENLKFWHNVHTQTNLTEEEYLNILKEVGLKNFAEEKVHIFSRGMTQKLTIARLLAQKPKLWLLDEPSTGLDVEARAFLLEKILQAKKENACVFWISHDVDKDKEYADFVHILENKTLRTENYHA